MDSKVNDNKGFLEPEPGWPGLCGDGKNCMQMNNMKGFVRMAAVIAVAACSAVSCGKDKDSGSISFERPAVYLDHSQSKVVNFTVDNIKSGTLSVTSKPEGWDDIVLDAAAHTLTVVSPSAEDTDAVSSGSVVVSGTPSGGGTAVTATLFVGVVAGTEDWSDRPANCYLANKKETEYLFDAAHNGRDVLATRRVEIVWQSVSGLVQYLHFDALSGTASFYVGADSDGKVKEGNALLGAYDAKGKLIWSWHVWATDFGPEAEGGTVEFNGYAMMARNLGSRATVSPSESGTLESFGLFYQWGRKDPFIGPALLNAANGTSAAMYDGDGKQVYMKTAASDSETGTPEYATANPLTFITAAEKDADWVYSGDAAGRWTADAKALCDPCPYGWRVAPADAFEGLEIRESLTGDVSDYRSKYGWTLGIGSEAAESFFVAPGRRSWHDASVQNYFDESLLARALQMQPWVGYYWTGGADGAVSPAFCLWLADTLADSGVRNARPMGRANGMQVRCVKER